MKTSGSKQQGDKYKKIKHQVQKQTTSIMLEIYRKFSHTKLILLPLDLKSLITSLKTCGRNIKGENSEYEISYFSLKKTRET
jgi:hypothetical protein